MVRHTICQQVLSMLHHTPTHITDLTASPGWESLFLWLLTPFNYNRSKCSTPGAESSEGLSDDEVVGSPTTYIDLNTVKTDSSASGGVESVSSEGVVGVSSDPGDDELSEDDRQYPIPDLTVLEASGGVTSVEGAATRQPHKKSRPVSMPPTTSLSITSEGQSSSDAIRRRTNAFLDSTTGEKKISVTSKGVVDEQRGRGFTKRHSLTYSRSWRNLSEVESEEVKRTFSVVTETIAYLLWHSVDYERDNPPWKVR